MMYKLTNSTYISKLCINQQQKLQWLIIFYNGFIRRRKRQWVLPFIAVRRSDMRSVGHSCDAKMPCRGHNCTTFLRIITVDYLSGNKDSKSINIFFSLQMQVCCNQFCSYSLTRYRKYQINMKYNAMASKNKLYMINDLKQKY